MAIAYYADVHVPSAVTEGLQQLELFAKCGEPEEVRNQVYYLPMR